MHAVDADKATTEPVIRRRDFLKAGAGLVGITILGPPLPPTADAVVSMSRGMPSVPGVARERIDGRIKVTGQKVFARDFNARDFGWGATQWHAIAPTLPLRRAGARWYLFMPCTVVAGNQAVWRAGIDHETYARVDGTWMFRHKRSEPLMSVPFETGWAKTRFV